jgi:ATP-dependent DNA ligase
MRSPRGPHRVRLCETVSTRSCSRSPRPRCRSRCPPPRDSRFGSPLVLGRVHWVRPELVAEVKYLTWTDNNLLRQVVYEGLREDKLAAEVRRPVPHRRS